MAASAAFPSSSSSSFLALLLAFLLLEAVVGRRLLSNDSRFDDSYGVTWGKDHVLSLDQGRQVQFSLDYSSGSGFASKTSYYSGFFHMRIKVPGRNSAGVVTAYYLTSHNEKHDELDFEFLGNKEGKPYTLQTNVYVNGKGDREQRFHLWFDPTADFHYYRILWNTHQIVFFVDDIPIRVFKNNSDIGVDYPSKPMQIEGSVWNGDWATDGGKTKINWSYAPFKAEFQGFSTHDICPSQNSNCYSPRLWWNGKKFWKLGSTHQKAYRTARKKYMNYDYCSDTNRYPVPPKECSTHQ